MTTEGLSNISMYAQWVGSLLIFLSCLPLFDQRNTAIKTLLFYSISSIMFQLGQQISMWFFGNKGLNQIGNGFVFFEALTLGIMFCVATKENLFRKVAAAMLTGYVVFYLVVALFFFEDSHYLIRTGRDLLMICSAISFFYYLLKKQPEGDLLRFPMFWINASVIFFFSGTLILSLMIGYIVNFFRDDFTVFWSFRNFFRFAFCLGLTYAGWLDWKLTKSRISQGQK